jgi:CheY-like chemotaxis protein
VVGQAADAAQLLDLVGEHLPDLAIIDIRMPPSYGTEGLAAAHHIREEFSDIGIVLVSAYVEVNAPWNCWPAVSGWATYSRVESPTSISLSTRSSGS